MTAASEALDCALALLVECERASRRWPELESGRLGAATARALLTLLAGLARRPPGDPALREISEAVIELRMLLSVARALELLDQARHDRLSGLATRLQATLLATARGAPQ
jgi:hypothetical protein